MDKEEGKKGGSFLGGLGGSAADYLQGLQFPETRDRVASFAREKGAPDFVVKKIQSMPEEKFDSAADVLRNL